MYLQKIFDKRRNKTYLSVARGYRDASGYYCQYKNGSSANNVINIAEEPFVLIKRNYIFHT